MVSFYAVFHKASVHNGCYEHSLFVKSVIKTRTTSSLCFVPLPLRFVKEEDCALPARTMVTLGLSDHL